MYFVCKSHSANIKCGIKTVIISGCNIYIFFMTKVLCSERCYKRMLATGGSTKRCGPHERRPQLSWAQSRWLGSSPGQKEGEGSCPSMWEGWVAIAEEEAVVDRVENAAGMERRFYAEASLDAAEEEVPVPGTQLCPFSLPLLSAADASPLWGPCVQHHPTCSETLACLGAQHTPWRKAH